MIVRTMPYSREEIKIVVQTRLKVEGLAIQEDALEKLADDGVRTSLRYVSPSLYSLSSTLGKACTDLGDGIQIRASTLDSSIDPLETSKPNGNHSGGCWRNGFIVLGCEVFGTNASQRWSVHAVDHDWELAEDKICRANEETNEHDQFYNSITSVASRQLQTFLHNSFGLLRLGSGARMSGLSFPLCFPFFARAPFFASKSHQRSLCPVPCLSLFLSLSRLSSSLSSTTQQTGSSHFSLRSLLASYSDAFLNRIQYTMRLPTLPLELIFIIRELAIPEPPFIDVYHPYAKRFYAERNAILRRFAVVHSSWLEFSRRQLARHVFVHFLGMERASVGETRKIDILSTALKSDAFRFFKTISLVLYGSYDHTVDWLDDGRWSEIQYLSCCEVQDGMLRKFPCE